MSGKCGGQKSALAVLKGSVITDSDTRNHKDHGDSEGITVLPCLQDGSKKVTFPMAFDAHNHIQLSLPGGIPALGAGKLGLENNISSRIVPSSPLDIYSPNIESDVMQLAQNVHDVFGGDDFEQRGVNDQKGPSYKYADTKVLKTLDAEEGTMRKSTGTRFSAPVGGIAIMSTQPRDFPIVEQLRSAINAIRSHDKMAANEQRQLQIVVPCYGVHPWFLKRAKLDFSKNEASHPDKQSEGQQQKQEEDEILSSGNNMLPWLPYLKEKLQSDPHSHLGEIGLDGARYEIDPVTQQKVLVSSMDYQIRAFEAQMHLAADLKRTVSIHAVQCWGPLMESLRRIKGTRLKMKKERKNCPNSDGNQDEFLILPPKIYFHAFGGKAAVVDQLDAICRDKSMASVASQIFYGFAPVINFRSPKTADVMQRVGIDRLVLETDLEDYQDVPEDMQTNAEYVAKVFKLDINDVLRRTFKNACALYNIDDSIPF